THTTETRTKYKHEKDSNQYPEYTGHKAENPNPVELHHGSGPTDRGHRTQVHIMERFGWQPVAHPENITRDMPPLLDSDRGEAREQLSCLIHEGGKIPDDKDLRMAGNAQIRDDRHTSDVIKRHPKGACQRGRLDTCRPKDSAGV